MAIRKIGIVSRTYQHVKRYRQILTVLAKYGFGDLVDRLHISHYLEIGLHLIGRHSAEQVEKLTRPERVRMILEELGPTFVKFGQMASTRPDLVPSEYIAELEKLCDGVPPFPFDEVREIVEEELKKPLEEAFAKFDEQSLAAASIGQVHRARLREGEEVVVKVQRPGIRQRIEVDLEILFHLATLIEQHVEDAKVLRPTKMAEEFAHVMEQELDFGVEKANLDRFARMFQNDPAVYVPKVYGDLSTGRVLTMEFVEGVRPGDMDKLAECGADRKRIALRGAEAILKQIFVEGFFHADPHSGNMFILPNDVICYLDFGMMGRLDRKNREDIADLIYGAASADARRTTAALLRLTEHDDDVDPDVRSIERHVSELLDLQIGTELGKVNLGELVQKLFNLVNRHELCVPGDLVTMFKALATSEGMGAALDPDLNMLKLATPYVRRVIMGRFSPGRVLGDIYESGSDLLELVHEIPSGLRELLKLARRGGVRMDVEHRGFEKLMDTHERVANRISFAIVVASLIVGSSLIVVSEMPPKFYEVPVVGLVGFIAAGVMGFTLLLSIIRHGRM